MRSIPFNRISCYTKAMFSLLSLLDDIATTLDDVAVMSKVAIEKTSALMSDDLAVNAGVIEGATPDRELPIVKAIFWGSLVNKVYCIIGVLTLTVIYEPLIKAILVIGGLYLAYEGVHKVLEKLFSTKDSESSKRKKIDEKEKIKGAIRTDLILSIEIIVIAKSTLEGNFLTQLVSLVAVGILASVIIYGLVAVIVKIDDVGLALIKKGFRKMGLLFVNSMPYLMRGLGIVGTLAMLLVGGGILSHSFHIPYIVNEILQNLILGLLAGAILVGVVEMKEKLAKQA